jgi:sortase A
VKLWPGKERPAVKKKKKIDFITPLLLLVCAAGLSLLAYPTVADWWNSWHQSAAIASYVESIENLNEEEYAQILYDANRYNVSLASHSTNYVLSDAQKEEYESLLNVAGNGVMAYIEIPSIKVYLPIYHGSDEAILQVAIGHLEWSSLPVGGTSTHAVISGHRGLSSATLFTNLDKLEVGDLFNIYVLDEVHAYEVDQIKIVDPSDLSDLKIIEGEDLVTMITCTPYGINSHRLLVRGHRVSGNAQISASRLSSDGKRLDPILMAPVLSIPVLIALLIALIVSKIKKFVEKG